MKKKFALLFMAFLAVMVVFSFGVCAEEFYADSDGFYTVELELGANHDYTLFAIKGLFDQTNYLEAYKNCTDEDIIYFGQATANDQGKVVFGPFAPLGYYDATLILGGTSLLEPALAGHLSAEGILNAQSIEIGGIQSRYTVNGKLGTDVEIDLAVSIFDSFGYPSVVEEEISLWVENAEGVTVDEENLKIIIDKNAESQIFTLKVATEAASDFVLVDVVREQAVANEALFYLDDTYTETITSVNVLGVAGVYPTKQVYAKLFDQFGDEIDEPLIYTFDNIVIGSSPYFTPTQTGTFSLVVGGTNSQEFGRLQVIVTNRPDYKGKALELYNLINASEAELKNLGKTVFVCEQNGKDIYPENMWISPKGEADFRTAINDAKLVLEKYNSNTANEADFSSAITKLTNARTTYQKAFKAGIRVDIKEISITKQDIRLAGGSDKETIDLSDYLVVDNKYHTDVLTWTSSNSEYVAVTQEGVVSTVENGTSVISVTTTTGLVATTTVTSFTKIKSIEMSANTTATYGSQPQYLTVTAYPTNQTDILIWENSNPEYARIEVSADGLRGKIVPVSAGKTTVTVTVQSSIGTNRVIKQTREVTVKMPNWKTVSAPVASLESGTITTSTKVTLSTETENARIYYTLDGTDPDPSMNIGRLYVAPIAINQNLTLKAIAVCDGMYDSRISRYSYTTIKPEIVVGSATTSPGMTADVDIMFKDAVSLKSLKFNVYYETANIQLVEATLNPAVEAYVKEPVINNVNGVFEFSLESQQAIAWNSQEPLLTLKFSALSYEREDKYKIGLGDVEMFDTLGKSIPVELNEGEITVKEFTLGDADGNGMYTLADIVIIKQYVLGAEDAIDKIDERAADFNQDGLITNQDATLLAKFFAGWEV